MILEKTIYAALWLLSAFLWYALDKKYGTRVYGIFDRLTSEPGKITEADTGFIKSQGAKFRFVMAAIVAVLQTWVFYRGVPLIEMIVVFASQTVVLWIGFYIAPAAAKLWKASDKAFDVVDKVSDGTIDVADEAKKIAETSKAFAIEQALHAKDKIEEVAVEARELIEPKIKEEKTAVPKEPEEHKPSMADFIARQRGTHERDK